MDNALNGPTNFNVSPAPLYPIITNAPASAGSGPCFHLCHTNPVAHILQLNQVLFPATNTTLSFRSMLGYATATEIARVQVASDGSTNWQDLYAQAGTNVAGETIFTQHTLSLSNCAGQAVLLRFNYDLTNINNQYTYYPYIQPNVGWCLQNMVLTNNQQLFNFATNATSSTSFTFTPLQTGSYILQAQGMIFNGLLLIWAW